MMATDEGDDTQAAITDDDASTCVVPGASGADGAELAWSAEQPETAQEELPWRDRARWATLAIAVITLSGATGWLATAFYEEQWGTPVPAAAPPTVVAASAPPPMEPRAPKSTAHDALPSPGPAAKHEEAPSPTPQAPPPPAAGVPPPLPDPPAHAYDTYVQLLARDGIISTNSPPEMHDKAYWVCRAVSVGDTTRLNTIIFESQLGDSTLSPGQVRTMLTDVVSAYCPEYRSLLN